MILNTAIRFKTAIGCIALFVLLAFVGNPFIPDVCTSMGYGYPYPVYVSWCGCFAEDYPSPIDPNYVLFDSLFWVGMWWVSSFAIKRKIRKTTDSERFNQTSR